MNPARINCSRWDGLFALPLLFIASCRSDAEHRPAASAPAPRAIAATQPVLVPAVDRVMPLCEYAGPIRRIVIHARAATLPAAAPSIRDLLHAFDPSTRIEIVCEGEATKAGLLARLKQWRLEQRPGLRLHAFPGAISQWARDRFIACVPAAWPVWLVPQIPASQAEPSRVSELDVPEAFAQVLPGLEIRHCALALEGGNIIASRDRVFLGVRVIDENAPAKTPKQTLEALARIFAGRSIIVGDERGRAPLAHLDLYMTLIGDTQAVLSSPALGGATLARADEAVRRETAKLLGDAPPDFSDERLAQFEEVAALLERRGLRITRLPHADNRGGDFAITYANVIQEVRDGRRIVYMPLYGIPPLDAAAKERYEELGFTVRPIDVSGLCHLLGMVRCLANVVERDPPPASRITPPAPAVVP